MDVSIPPQIIEKLVTFGELLRYLRRRAALTQTELSIAVGYSDAQISRLEKNLRLPNLATVQARFVPVLTLKHETAAMEHLLHLAQGGQCAGRKQAAAGEDIFTLCFNVNLEGKE